ncbi:hypothetical protein [Chishuiella changwenlii]|uniref:hypothetical protein n=1 Tax=Chishuiella changwenlii TaxID=1434701 RepID=UPI002FD88FD8
MVAVVYLLDNIPFKNYNVLVSDSSGIFDKTKFKEGIKKDWSDEHGFDVDLQNRFKDSRTISISCFVYAKSLKEAIEKYNTFLNEIDKKGSKRISVIVDSLRMECQVFRDNSAETNLIYNDSDAVATFTLNLIENFPVKRILQSKSKTTTITISSNKVMVINWGDGVEQYTSSSIQNYSHTYLNDNIYYPIIMGDLDTITQFQTNADILWSKF